MNHTPDQYAGPWIQGLMRFSTLYLGDPTAAEEVVRAVVIETARHADDFKDSAKCARHMFYHLRLRCRERAGLKPARIKNSEGNLSAQDAPQIEGLGEGVVSGWFCELPEPQRGAAILFYMDLFPLPELERILGMHTPELGLALRETRLHFAALAASQPNMDHVGN